MSSAPDPDDGWLSRPVAHLVADDDDCDGWRIPPAPEELFTEHAATQWHYADEDSVPCYHIAFWAQKRGLRLDVDCDGPFGLTEDGGQDWLRFARLTAEYAPWEGIRFHEDVAPGGSDCDGSP